MRPETTFYKDDLAEHIVFSFAGDAAYPDTGLSPNGPSGVASDLDVSERVSLINRFYHGLTSPYQHALDAIGVSLREKTRQMAVGSALPSAETRSTRSVWTSITDVFRKRKAGEIELQQRLATVLQEICELEEGLSWAAGKIRVLEKERKEKISAELLSHDCKALHRTAFRNQPDEISAS